MQLLDPARHLVQRGIKEGIGISGQHALRQIAWLDEQKPVKRTLGKLPVDGWPNIKCRHDGERTISAHAVWMVERQPITDARSPVMSYDGKAIVTKRAHHCDELRPDCSLVQWACVQNATLPIARQIRCNNGVALRQCGCDIVPGGVTLRIAMQQKDRRPLSAHYACEAHVRGQSLERRKSFEQGRGLVHVDIFHRVGMPYRCRFFHGEKSSEGADEGQQILP